MTLTQQDAARPLVKWAGGKSRIASALLARIPSDVIADLRDASGSRRLVEPFVGGGAFLCAAAPRAGLISDANAELVNMYCVCRDSPDALCRVLEEVETAATAAQDLGLHFYARREELNALMAQAEPPENAVRRAALFIFLNKYSFNGLWRVNASGQYNVPFGHVTKRVRIFTPENVRRMAALLCGKRIEAWDYLRSLESASEGDFIYLDPPYDSGDPSESFTKYTAGGFDWDDQQELFATVISLLGAHSDIKIMISNSSTARIRAMYGSALAKSAGLRVEEILAPRTIAADKNRRAPIHEVVVTNF